MPIAHNTTRWRTGLISLCCVSLAILTGCASNSGLGSNGVQTGSLAATPVSDAFDCKRMTGSMQIRILQLRTYNENEQASALSRAFSSVTTPLFGGSAAQAPNGKYQRDVAQLETDNARLAAAGCKTYDLKAELAETDMSKTPRPR